MKKKSFKKKLIKEIPLYCKISKIHELHILKRGNGCKAIGVRVIVERDIEETMENERVIKSIKEKKKHKLDKKLSKKGEQYEG